MIITTVFANTRTLHIYIYNLPILSSIYTRFGLDFASLLILYANINDNIHKLPHQQFPPICPNWQVSSYMAYTGQRLYFSTWQRPKFVAWTPKKCVFRLDSTAFSRKTPCIWITCNNSQGRYWRLQSANKCTKIAEQCSSLYHQTASTENSIMISGVPHNGFFPFSCSPDGCG